MLHMAAAHGSLEPVEIFCGLNGCAGRLGHVASFSKHCRRMHKDLWEVADRRVTLEQIDNLDDFEGGNDRVEDYCDVVPPHTSSALMLTEMKEWVRENSLLLRLKMEHERVLATSTANEIFSDVVNFVSLYHHRLEDVILKRLSEPDDENEGNELSQLCQASNMAGAFKATEAIRKRKLESFGFVEPERHFMQDLDSCCVVELPEPPCDDQATAEAVDDPQAPSHSQDIAEAVDDPEPLIPVSLPEPGAAAQDDEAVPNGVMYYVSIKETLCQYLKHPAVVDSILRERVQHGHLSKYCDGIDFQTHPVFKDKPHALRLHLYLDELEICNPLGGAKGKHKITVVYFLVGNLEMHHLSSTRSIHLALIAEYNSICKYGYGKALRPLIDDLKTLQTEGIRVVGEGGEETLWYGSVAVVSGDNSTQHEVAGFRKYFSGGKVCRFCLIEKTEISSVFHESDCQLRTEDVVRFHIQSVQNHPELCKLYSVRGDSAFFHLGIGHRVELFAVDPLHDLIEGGLIQLHVTNLIRTLVKTGVLTLARLRRLVNKFKYGKIDRSDKPPAIQQRFMHKDCSLCGSGAQKWMLFHILPIILGDLVPADNKYWKLYMMFTEICEIVFATDVHPDWINVLEQKIAQHHKLWSRLYPESTYKIHALLHYPRLFLLLGPLRHVGTFRFEANHQFLKKLARVVNQFICFPKTGAFRYQKRMAFQTGSKGVLPTELTYVGAQASFKVCQLRQDEQDAFKSMTELEEDDVVLKLNGGVKWRGIRLFIDSYVIVHFDSCGDPVFFKIKSVFVVHDKVVMLGKLTHVICKDHHRGSFKVKVSNNPEDTLFLLPSDVVSPQSCDAYRVGGQLHVKLKFRPLDTSTC